MLMIFNTVSLQDLRPAFVENYLLNGDVEELTLDSGGYLHEMSPVLADGSLACNVYGREAARRLHAK